MAGCPRGDGRRAVPVAGALIVMKLLFIVALNTLGIALTDVTNQDRVWAEEFGVLAYLGGPSLILGLAIFEFGLESLRRLASR